MSGRGSGTFNLYSILKCQKLDELIYCPQEEVSQNDEMINMPQLPIICPKIRHFVFDRYSLKIDCTKSNGLKASFSEIERCKKIKELNNLEILNLKQFQGSLEEIWFVMSVLASTPLLKKIVISFHRGVDEANASRIYQWLICLTILPGSPLNKLSRPEPTPWAGPALEDISGPKRTLGLAFLTQRKPTQQNNSMPCKDINNLDDTYLAKKATRVSK
uniref:FBD domain-containing protein n=1 Tax=Solanum tuberosum TaxID=4113 RepID=M1DVF7_SOLTU